MEVQKRGKMNHKRLGSGGTDSAGKVSINASRVFEGLGMYYRPFGVSGLFALAGYRLFGWPEELVVQPPEITHPVRLRIRTSDVSVCEEILIRGQYAIELPFSPRIIVDAGANIGMASIYYTNKYPDARIIAIEPEASNFAMLVRNVKPYPEIFPLNAALWKNDGEIAVRSSHPISDKVGFVVHEGEGATVRALTVRTLMHEEQIHSIDILKMDIEGAEREVFESAEWIDAVRCLIIELHDRFRPGCRAAVESVTGDFLSWQTGETTIFVRKSSTTSSVT